MTEIFDLVSKTLIHITKDINNLREFEIINLVINCILISLLIIKVYNLIQSLKQQ